MSIGKNKLRKLIFSDDQPDIDLVPLTRGQVAIIDRNDAELVGQWNWIAWPKIWKNKILYFYAKNGNRQIGSLFLEMPSGCQIDHKDGNPLNNKRDNLRVATSRQNSINRGIRSDSISNLKGVGYRPDSKQWRARIVYGGKRHSLGAFDSMEDAKKAYEAAAEVHHGEFRKAA